MHANNVDLDVSVISVGNEAKAAYYNMLKPHLTGKHDVNVVVGNIEKIVHLWGYNLAKFFDMYHMFSVNCKARKTCSLLVIVRRAYI